MSTTAADWWDYNKTAALLRSAEAARNLDAGVRAVLKRDDRTTAQKREITETISSHQLTSAVQDMSMSGAHH